MAKVVKERVVFPMTVAEVGERVARLPKAPDAPPPHHTWARHRWELRRDLVEKDLADFTHWPTIVATMFVGDAPYIEREWKLVSSYPRYLEIAEEFPLGRPDPYRGTPASGNSIHQTYHLARFESLAGVKVEDLTDVIEFGGGYGALRARFERAGYDGEYLIYDTPEFSILQQWYLSNLGIPTGYRPLDEQMRFAVPPRGASLFAFYSLSEVDENLRNAFFHLCAPARAFIASQDAYLEPLRPAFERFTRQFKDYEWEFQDIEHLPGHFYLYGELKT